MSAIRPKRTSLAAPHMSAFGGKADIANTYARSDYYSAAAREPVILTEACTATAASASSISWLAIRGPIGSNIGVPEWED